MYWESLSHDDLFFWVCVNSFMREDATLGYSYFSIDSHTFSYGSQSLNSSPFPDFAVPWNNWVFDISMLSDLSIAQYGTVFQPSPLAYFRVSSYNHIRPKLTVFTYGCRWMNVYALFFILLWWMKFQISLLPFQIILGLSNIKPELIL